MPRPTRCVPNQRPPAAAPLLLLVLLLLLLLLLVVALVAALLGGELVGVGELWELVGLAGNGAEVPEVGVLG